MSCLFNSYDPYFKQPFGAVRAGQSVHLTLCIPEELGYVDPHLVLQKEGKYDVPVHYRMKFDGQTPHQNHFSVDVVLGDPGLYFYYFDLYTDFRRIVRGADNCGVVSWQEGESWQITVYEPDFQTPECIKGKVFYQIFPDRFCEGIENKPMPFPDRLYQADKHAEPFWQPNETGGHLNEDYFGGDLEGIRIKLPYLQEMGVDYIYLNPIFEAHSNHRYNTADYLNVDPLLGTNEEWPNTGWYFVPFSLDNLDYLVRKYLYPTDLYKSNGAFQTDKIKPGNNYWPYATIASRDDNANPTSTSYNLTQNIVTHMAPYYKVGFPATLKYTPEEAEELSLLELDLDTYIATMESKMIRGDLKIDETWDEFVKGCESCNLGRYLEIVQAAYDRYAK